jgi:glycosyltransferase involved in cell wall biosynthesis
VNFEKKINLLVIPDLFPKFDGDVQGIFVVDYLRTVKNYCNINVLFLKLRGKKGLNIETTDVGIIYRYCVSEKKLPSFLKPFAYIIWFIKGYQIGKELKNTDIIHSHGAILSGTLSWLLSIKLKVPFIITEHQGPFSMTSENFWKLHWTRFIMQKANAVLTVSEHLKREILTADIHPKKTIVTYNPVDTDLFKLKTNAITTNNILFVGRMDEFKGALRCVKAFEKIASNNPLHTLTLVGNGKDMQFIKDYIKAHSHLKNKIILKGTLTKEPIANEMRQSDFFVFPSRHESFGLVIAEALSCGLPVIVGNQTAPKEYVTKDIGLLIPPDDIDAIANAMQDVINNLKSYDAHNIRKHITTNFSFDVFGKKLQLIYQSELCS